MDTDITTRLSGRYCNYNFSRNLLIKLINKLPTYFIIEKLSLVACEVSHMACSGVRVGIKSEVEVFDT